MTGPVSNMSISRFLVDQGIDQSRAFIDISDAAFVMPDEDWIRTTFADHVRDVISKDVGFYDKEKADCDDFAECCATEAHKLHRKTKGSPPAGLAFGSFYYKQDIGSHHAINFAIVVENDALKLVFFEPQRQEIIKLSKREIQSCTSVRL